MSNSSAPTFLLNWIPSFGDDILESRIQELERKELNKYQEDDLSLGTTEEIHSRDLNLTARLPNPPDPFLTLDVSPQTVPITISVKTIVVKERWTFQPRNRFHAIFLDERLLVLALTFALLIFCVELMGRAEDHEAAVSNKGWLWCFIRILVVWVAVHAYVAVVHSWDCWLEDMRDAFLEDEGDDA